MSNTNEPKRATFRVIAICPNGHETTLSRAELDYEEEGSGRGYYSTPSERLYGSWKCNECDPEHPSLSQYHTARIDTNLENA